MKTTFRLIIAGMLASATALPAANIIVNGSFETNTSTTTGYIPAGASNELGNNVELYNAHAAGGLVPGWSGTSRTWLFNDIGGANFSDGVYATEIDARIDQNGVDVLAQTGLSLTAGTIYTLTFDMWGRGNFLTTNGLDVRLTYGFGDALVHTDGTGLTLLDEKTTVGNDGFYETVTVEVSPTVTDSNYALQFFMDDSGISEAHVFIDNVILTVPEPSSTALLGLGAFGLMLRRKRS